MKSKLIEKVILLKRMLEDMEQDIGLSSLTNVEKSVYLAAQDVKSPDGLVGTKLILSHPFTQKMSRPTFFRALKAIETKGFIKHSDAKKVGLFLICKI
jgi:hypothetical protein|tara:strand:- start:584 stop:877 length:294 start_codon:yes stop_codon:yes gene_type:complete